MFLRGFYERATQPIIFRTFSLNFLILNRFFHEHPLCASSNFHKFERSLCAARKLSISYANWRELKNLNIISSCEIGNDTHDMDRILNVAEKNDAAKSLAEIMSRGGYRKREGFSVYNKIYEFPYRIFNRDATMIMTSVSGHLLNYQFSLQYKNWKSCNPVTLFDAPLQKSCPNEYEDIKRTLEREIHNCSMLIIWTDCDREGENIGHEIVQVCSKVKPNIKVLRATFSEITHQAVTRAISNLGVPNQNVINAVDVRQELDLRIGAAFTRFQTLRLQRVFPDVLTEMLISYGSCQFPTLGFVVERYKQVQSFIAEPFWKIEVTCQSEEGEVKFNWKRQRLFDYDACRSLYEHCIENPEMTVVDIQSKPKSKWRPYALDTVELEKLSSRKLKISAKETMTIAEKLYTKGFISYPRTETNAFPKGFDLSTLIGHQTQDAHWGEFAQKLLEKGPTPRNGTKSDQAHPPIHPTKYTNGLQGKEKSIYEFIVRHFLACCSQDAQGQETIIEAELSEEKFTLSGLMITAKNYLEVYPYDKWSDKNIPVFSIGEKFVPKLIEMTQSETSPPSLLTEADLIALMEKHGIGTDATHAEHIETIKSRLYVGLRDGKFVPGELGMGLVEGYDAMGFEMSKPHLRAELEADLKRICLGEKNKDVVLAEQIRKYKEVFVAAVQQADKIDSALSQYFGQAQVPPPIPSMDINLHPICKCPFCGQDMIIKSKRDRQGFYLSCVGFPDCRTVMWFPQSVLEASPADEVCTTCTSHGSPMHKIKFKFRRDAMPFGVGEDMTSCVGGCDHDLEQLLGSRFPRPATNNPGLSNHDGGGGGGGSRRNNGDDLSSFQGPKRPLSSSQSSLRMVDSGFSSMPPPSQPNSRSSSNSRPLPLSHLNNHTASHNGYGAISTQPLTQSSSSSSNNVVCHCGEDARLLTVRKEGVNNGRLFYSCQKCGFFLWADNPPENNSNSTGTSFRGGSQSQLPRNNVRTEVNGQGVLCNCNLQAKEKRVQKEGENKGRPFLSCPKPMGQHCNFFQWNDESSDIRGSSAGPSSSHSNRSNNNNKDQENKKKRKCGICGEEGHTRKTCPHKR